MAGDNVYVPIEGFNLAAGIGSGAEIPNHTAGVVVLCGVVNGSIVRPVAVDSDGKVMTV